MSELKTNKIFFILTFLGVYLLATGISFAAFNSLRKAKPSKPISPGVDLGENLLLDVSGPKTEECPLNGKMFTQVEKEAWEKRRPLFVMIENHKEARPQSGLSESDVIYEIVAEGGITRFGAVFYCGAMAKEDIIGPVRSARTYFLDLASEYGKTPLYVHVGGAHCDPQTREGCLNNAKADALGQIVTYGWEGENDLNQFSIGYPTFWRDYERIGHTVATEHTMYTTSERLWAVGKERDWTNTNPKGIDWQKSFSKWAFKDDADKGKEAKVEKIEFPFWADYKDYSVIWEYNKETNDYRRFNGGQPHLDFNTKKQLKTKNIVIQFAKESPANDGYPGNVHLLYNLIGKGKALIFQDGQVYKAKWSKSSRKARTEFYLDSGKEVKFVRGRIWIEVLPLGTKVEY